MNVQERRESILNLLNESDTPVSGGFLAKSYDVSRQVIVQDIALLRAAGHNIMSTNRGYTLTHTKTTERIFKVTAENEDILDKIESLLDEKGFLTK